LPIRGGEHQPVTISGDELVNIPYTYTVG